MLPQIAIAPPIQKPALRPQRANTIPAGIDAHITPIGHCPVRNGGIYVAVSERLGSVLGKLEVRSGGRIANVLLDRGEIAQLRVALDDLDAALSQTTPSKGTKP